ncbi:MAG: thioredoxin-disulfide reductase [Bacteriovoracaceae bacterium]|nr:thioredoxin-disulfide reductase [Bacteriovoracaceae bacterium]
MESRKVVIIGTGPAGLTAAIYASRALLRPLVIEGYQPGGQLTTTTEVENFPGFIDGIMGPELMSNMKSQAERFGTEYLSANVTEVDLSKRPFTIKCDNGDELKSDSIIISTGASARYLGLENEKELIGRGVSACATCDGFFYNGKDVIVIGGGDTAIEEAAFLTKFARKVYIVHRRDTLRASKPMQQRAFDNEKIEFIWDSTIAEILFDQSGVTGAKLQNLKTSELSDLKIDGIFMAIGHNPNTSFLGGQVKLDSHGFIDTFNGPHTNIEGVFACGDVQDPTYRQGITAAGSGCQAAITAERWLGEQE